MAHNRALKEQIDSLRKERLVFDSVYRKLQKELGDKKAEMEQVRHTTYFESAVITTRPDPIFVIDLLLFRLLQFIISMLL